MRRIEREIERWAFLLRLYRIMGADDPDARRAAHNLEMMVCIQCAIRCQKNSRRVIFFNSIL